MYKKDNLGRIARCETEVAGETPVFGVRVGFRARGWGHHRFLACSE